MHNAEAADGGGAHPVDPSWKSPALYALGMHGPYEASSHALIFPPKKTWTNQLWPRPFIRVKAKQKRRKGSAQGHAPPRPCTHPARGGAGRGAPSPGVSGRRGRWSFGDDKRRARGRAPGARRCARGAGGKFPGFARRAVSRLATSQHLRPRKDPERAGCMRTKGNAAHGLPVGQPGRAAATGARSHLVLQALLSSGWSRGGTACLPPNGAIEEGTGRGRRRRSAASPVNRRGPTPPGWPCLGLGFQRTPWGRPPGPARQRCELHTLGNPGQKVLPATGGFSRRQLLSVSPLLYWLTMHL